MKFRTTEKKILSGVGLSTYISGVSLFILSRWIRVPSPVGEQRHPMEYWVRVSHSILTYMIVMSVGYLIKSHILPGIKSRHKKRIKTGLAILSVFIVLVGTALGTLYVGESSQSISVGQIHAIVGILTPLFIILHLKRGN